MTPVHDVAGAVGFSTHQRGKARSAIEPAGKNRFRAERPGFARQNDEDGLGDLFRQMRIPDPAQGAEWTMLICRATSISNAPSDALAANSRTNAMSSVIIYILNGRQREEVTNYF